MAGEDGLGAGRDAADGFAVFGGVAFNERADEVGEVFHALGKGRQVELDHGEAVIEVFAKFAAAHHGFEVAIGGGDHAAGDLLRGIGADGFDLLLLDGAEELRLHGEGHVAEFVEEEGATVGGFEHTLLVVGGAGEGALDVAEHLAFKERFGDGGAVADDKGAGGDGGLAMEGGGGEFLTGAGGAADEGHAEVGADAADHGEEFEHLSAVADHAFKAVGADEFGFEASGVDALLEVFEELADAGAKGGDLNGLGEIVAGAAADGFDGGFGGVVAGEEEDVGGGGVLEDFLSEFEAGAAGEHEVEDDDLGAFGVDDLHGRVRIEGGEDTNGKGAEGVREEFEREGVVVDGEDGDWLGQASLG